MPDGPQKCLTKLSVCGILYLEICEIELTSLSHHGKGGGIHNEEEQALALARNVGGRFGPSSLRAGAWERGNTYANADRKTIWQILEEIFYLMND